MHMLIWPHPDDRPNSVDKIDELVSAEIPDKKADPVAYEAVKNYMMHGPCGKDCMYSPCMVRGKCYRHFPKRYYISILLRSDAKTYEYKWNTLFNLLPQIMLSVLSVKNFNFGTVFFTDIMAKHSLMILDSRYIIDVGPEDL